MRQPGRGEQHLRDLPRVESAGGRVRAEEEAFQTGACTEETLTSGLFCCLLHWPDGDFDPKYVQKINKGLTGECVIPKRKPV